MAESVEATTITRMINPDIWGLNNHQLAVFFGAAGVTAGYAITKALFLPDSLVFSVAGALTTVVSWGFFAKVGLNRERLYHFERRLKFGFSRMQGEELIQKYNDKDENKTKNFTNIKNIFKNGVAEFFPDEWGNGMKNNFAVFIKLFAYSPEDLDAFFINAENTLSSAPDGTIIKTILEARKSTGDSSAPFKRELKKDNLHPVIRDVCYEQVELCQGSNSKTYLTHMAFIIPYTTDRKEAFKTLDNLYFAVHKQLKVLGVEDKRLDTPEKVYAMFDGMITHNLHVARRGIE